MTLPTPLRCSFPGCKNFADHTHHVVYDPDVTKPLCRKHHEDITIINGIQGRKYRRSLSRKQRFFIWYGFLEGRFKPKRTKKALEYLQEWDTPLR